MDKEQLAWQRKIIREEHLEDAGQNRLSNTPILSTAQTLQNRRSQRAKGMGKKMGSTLSQNTREKKPGTRPGKELI